MTDKNNTLSNHLHDTLIPESDWAAVESRLSHRDIKIASINKERAARKEKWENRISYIFDFKKIMWALIILNIAAGTIAMDHSIKKNWNHNMPDARDKNYSDPFVFPDR